MPALLVNHGQEILYIPGRLVNRAADGYRGEGKTDARDAYIIADQARMRRDPRPIRPGDEAAIELKLLTGRRADLVEDRTRVVNRLRGTLLSMFPALERALDVTNTGPLKLLTGYQTPASIRRTGVTRLTRWLANRKVRNARSLAETAVEAAERQHTAVPGEKTTAKLVHTLAEEVMALNEHISEMDKLIEGRFREHELAAIVESIPGIGTVLGAEFLAAVGGSLDDFDSPDALAAFAGVAPAPKDSGKVSGNLHRPMTYHRRLQRVFYTSALVSIRCDTNSRKFYVRHNTTSDHYGLTTTLGSVAPSVTDQGPQNVDPAAGEREHGLDVSFSFGALAVTPPSLPGARR